MIRLSRVSPYLTVAGAVLAGGFLFLAAMVAGRLFAPQAPTTAKLTTYECGVDPVGDGWAQTSAPGWSGSRRPARAAPVDLMTTDPMILKAVVKL